jgi:hypothetical protein
LWGVVTDLLDARRQIAHRLIGGYPVIAVIDRYAERSCYVHLNRHRARKQRQSRNLLLPFRIVGIAVGGVFELLGAIITLPARLLRPRRASA